MPRHLLTIVCLFTSSFAYAQSDYERTVTKANAAVRTGAHAEAIKLYRAALATQRCEKPPVIRSVAELTRGDPCWRILALLFNIGLAQKNAGHDQEAKRAFESYLSQWGRYFPKIHKVPLEERARFELAEVAFRAKDWSRALEGYRLTLSLWNDRHPGKTAEFAETAERRVAECLEKAGRRKEAADAYHRYLTSHEKRTGRQHPDAAFLRKRIATLRAPLPKKKPLRPIVIREQAPSRAWLYTGIALGALAVASEAMAIGFWFRGKSRFKTDPALDTDQALMTTGHVVAGVAAAGAIAAVITHIFHAKQEEKRPPTWRAQLSPWGMSFKMNF